MSSSKYLGWGMKTVDGWLYPFSARFIAGLPSVHRKLGVTGSVGEIGVHHGKLFILLHSDADKTRSFAIDVFEDQHLNTDQSGKGSYNRFVRNVRRWCGTSDGIEIIKRSSLDVRPSDITAAVGEVRLFSIDGGHTEECAYNDLLLADATLGDYGVVILDDVFNPQWPGVLTGLAKYMEKDGRGLHPFALTPGKVYMARSEAIPTLRREIASRFEKFWDKDSEFFGSHVDIYGIYEMNQPIKHKTKRALESIGLANAASSLKSAFVR